MKAKETGKRLILFLIICFALSWTFDFTIYSKLPTMKNDVLRILLSYLTMYFPLIAHFITRALTKEGFACFGEDSLMLKISPKKFVWILVAVLLPYIYCELGNGILKLMFPELFLSKTMQSALGLNAHVIVRTLGRNLLGGLLFTFVAIGEESGFRGYMMPKLVQLFGLKKSLLFGGILWGLWHLPLIMMGLNYGTEYPGYPYLGILFMVLECFSAGTILTFLTIRSKSIWPAAIMHAINNSTPGFLALIRNTREVSQNVGWRNSLTVSMVTRAPLIILGILCYIYIYRKESELERDRCPFG